ncbi:MULTISPECIES: hypothetical protein [unclassified Beijerinckia]|uniref:hypothetical protein n=1 Tax=unclassified Beijerinckia TaxID=2638183 RepID=UPI00089C64EA|nr:MULTISPECIES: hypothetical protein [unclassified Beijerinckia]MDH7798848.1 hypothetical protein [Beijerinckia sp. GAS462]SED89091.1 iron(III) transport system substrate-binding protein [Beijerinckia sp. 28-YEA-48]
MRHKKLSSIIAMCCAVSFGGAARAQQLKLPEGIEKLRVAAEAEQQVALFVSTDARTAADEAKIEEALRADTGVKLDIKLVSGPPDPIYLQQLSRELKAKVAPSVDLIVTIPPLIRGLIDIDAVAPVNWQDLGAKPEDVYPAFYALFSAELARPIIYNTKVIARNEAPSSIDGLLGAKWAGKIVTANVPDLYTPWAIVLGEDGVMKLIDRFYGDLKVSIAPAPTAIRTRVETGEYPLGFGIRIARQQSMAGAPVAYAPIPTPLVPRLAIVLKGSRKQNAAALVGWWLSQTQKGQRISADVLDWPRHTTPGTDLHDLATQPGGVRTAAFDWWSKDAIDIGGRIAKALRAK